jgi:hypothetical protein
MAEFSVFSGGHMGETSFGKTSFNPEAKTQPLISWRAEIV